MDPANQILQKRDVGLRQAVPIIEAVKTGVQELRSDENFQRFVDKTDEIMASHSITPRVRRARQQSTRLRDSIVMSTTGQNQFEDEISELKSVYYEIIDSISNEMKDRFDNNCEILNAIDSVQDLDRDSLLPLSEIGVEIPEQAELTVVKRFLAKERMKPEFEKVSTLKILYPVKDAFIATYRLFEAIETIGASTAVNECSFSAVSRIDTVKRMSMSSQRLCDLSFLAFEKKTTTFH